MQTKHYTIKINIICFCHSVYVSKIHLAVAQITQCCTYGGFHHFFFSKKMQLD